MTVKLIKPGDTDRLVALWKSFLAQLNLYNDPVNSYYNTEFSQAVKKFQYIQRLETTGEIDNATWLQAIQSGLGLNDQQRNSLPFKPAFSPLSNAAVKKHFGVLQFVHDPVPDNRENITIINDFESKNIIFVHIPQLSVITSGGETGMLFHRKAAKQLIAFFSLIEDKGLLHKVLTFNGSYVPRLVRNSKNRLSNHSFGIAFDINAQWNSLGCTPAALGEKGSVRELVPLAHRCGFYWGGHFSRKDGMHFEIAQIV